MMKFSLPRFLLLVALTVFSLAFFLMLYVHIQDQRISLIDATKTAFISSGLLALLTLSLVAGVSAFVGMISMLFRLACSRKEGVSAFDRKLLYSPFAVVFMPKYLTVDGESARKKFFNYLLMFIAAILGGFCIGWITKYV